MLTLFKIYEKTLNESVCTVKQLQNDGVNNLLNTIDSYNKNKHYSREKFERHTESDSTYYGLFDENDICVSLISVIENTPVEGLTYFQELASFIPGKGYGVTLLEKILEKYENVWWMASPDGGEALADNYRKIPGIEEFTIPRSSYKNLPIHFFFKFPGINAEENKTKLIKFVTGVYGPKD